MNKSSTKPLGRWRFGIHPGAVGSTIRSVGRIDLPIGEALRIELETADSAGGKADLQYYISTASGGWALWLSCPSGDLEQLEATLREITPPFDE